MEVLRSGSSKIAGVRQVTLRLRALASRTEPVAANRVQATKVANNEIIADKQFPLPGNVSSQVAFSGVVMPKVEMPIKSEVTAMECPVAVLKKAQELWPQKKMENVSVVNFVQETKSNMGEWSAQMELEWTGLTSEFNQKAVQTCEILKGMGYWADFVDPATGKAFLSESKSDVSLLATDEEYRSMGFDVIDMGCCKVLSHPLFGKRVFVGTLFTDAPTEVLSHI
uniref:Methylmalonic aciduria and homocystinuria type D-like protein, mitochondrial n=1 Tax=Syphacia muris TaxID=451379 RepID=A0A0N5B053_9BILA